MNSPVLGRLYREKHPALRCHLQASGHQQLIATDKPYYKVTTGKAQGLYHGPQCYNTALKQYEAAEKVLKLKSEAENT